MPPVDSESGRALFRRLAIAVYLPWFLAMLGRGMLIPVLPVYLRESGLSFTMVAVVLASVGLGSVVGGLPAGAFAGRFGPELLFVGATIAAAITTALLGVSTAVVALVAFRLAFGFGTAGIRISMQMLVIQAVPLHLRGRGMSTLGGAIRLGTFVGPILGGLLVDLVGFGVTFLVTGIVTLVGLVPFLAVRRDRAQRFDRPAVPLSNLRATLVQHRNLLLMAGIGTALVMTVRAGRNVVVPLIGDELGMGATAVGALVAVGTGADLMLFPVAGWLMDRYGRLASIVPAFSLLGLGMLVLGLSSTVAGAIVAGVIMGVGNGVSAGTMMTLGGDLAPPEAGPFLASLGMMQDMGVVLGPIVVGWFADRAGLGTSAIALAAVMFAAITWIVVVLGDTAHPSRPWLVRELEATRVAPASTLE